MQPQGKQPTPQYSLERSQGACQEKHEEGGHKACVSLMAPCKALDITKFILRATAFVGQST